MVYLTVVSSAASWLHTHWQAVLWWMSLWFIAGNYLATKYPIPPRTAPWWKRVLHFALVNLPELGEQLDGKTVLGFTFSFPGIWKLRPRAAADELLDKAKRALGEQQPPQPPPPVEKGAIDLLVLI